ncbi:MAG: amidohydrolase [Gammaproteobacteria bacterium]|nr:amidohydrolase [Gammaproteobacteria bacterium]
MRDLSVSVVQDVLSWQDPAANRRRYDEHFETLGDGNQKPDLVVLPETFSTGFTMSPWEACETMEGETVNWVTQRARELGAVITGSLIMKLDEQYVNRMIWARPDGEMTYYDKRHLFRFGGEHHHYTSGDKRVIVDVNGWRIALFICYDLRFPVWSRNREDYDVGIYVANWPVARQYAWDTLIKARAIENQVYVLASNRLGDDPVGNVYYGGSAILDFMGQPMVDCEDRVMVANASLSMEPLAKFRDDFPAAMDRDEFEIRV